MKEIYLILSHTPSFEKQQMLRQLVYSINKHGKQIMVVSHTQIPKDIEDMCYYPKEKKEFTEVLKKVVLDLKSVEWDVVLLGCNPKEDLKYVTDNLYSVTKSTGSWAYLIKKRAYEHLIDNINYKKDYIAIDDHLCLLSSKGFKVLTTIPLMINHAVGFVSTLQPNGPVNYDVWIQGNYHNFIYDKLNKE